MSPEILRNFLLWCTVINLGFLLIWSLLFVFPHNWLYRSSARWFRMTAEQFDAINFAGITFYEVAILLFNLVPYIALSIVR